MESEERATTDTASLAEIERKRRLLHDRLANDPDFVRESEELHRRLDDGAPSPDRVAASELNRRLRERKL